MPSLLDWKRRWRLRRAPPGPLRDYLQQPFAHPRTDYRELEYLAIDLARVYALSAGIPEINTIERLQAAAECGALSRDGSANLIDALEFIGTLRMRHQARQLRAGQKADNFVSPDALSPLERGHLKEAFLLINTMQESLGQRHQAGRFA